MRYNEEDPIYNRFLVPGLSSGVNQEKVIRNEPIPTTVSEDRSPIIWRPKTTISIEPIDSQRKQLFDEPSTSLLEVMLKKLECADTSYLLKTKLDSPKGRQAIDFMKEYVRAVSSGYEIVISNDQVVLCRVSEGYKLNREDNIATLIKDKTLEPIFSVTIGQKSVELSQKKGIFSGDSARREVRVLESGYKERSNLSAGTKPNAPHYKVRDVWNQLAKYVDLKQRITVKNNQV